MRNKGAKPSRGLVFRWDNTFRDGRTCTQDKLNLNAENNIHAVLLGNKSAFDTVRHDALLKCDLSLCIVIKMTFYYQSLVFEPVFFHHQLKNRRSN